MNMHRIPHGGPGEIPPVDERVPAEDAPTVTKAQAVAARQP